MKSVRERRRADRRHMANMLLTLTLDVNDRETGLFVQRLGETLTMAQDVAVAISKRIEGGRIEEAHNLADELAISIGSAMKKAVKAVGCRELPDGKPPRIVR